jgi:hypothetical protein
VFCILWNALLAALAGAFTTTVTNEWLTKVIGRPAYLEAMPQMGTYEKKRQDRSRSCLEQSLGFVDFLPLCLYSEPPSTAHDALCGQLLKTTVFLPIELPMMPSGTRSLTGRAVLFGCLYLLAAGAGTAGAEPPAGVWVVAEGMSPFLHDLSLDEVRGRARDEARRNAIEKAVGLFVRGTTILHNAQITDELIASVARGVIEEEEWVDERIEEVSEKRSGPKLAVWHSKVKARVRPVHVERRAGFELRASLNKTVFQEVKPAGLHPSVQRHPGRRGDPPAPQSLSHRQPL